MINRVGLAAVMSDVLGKTIDAAEPTLAEWAEMARVPEGPVRHGLERMYADYDQFGFPGGNSVVLQAVLGREPRTIEHFVRELSSR